MNAIEQLKEKLHNSQKIYGTTVCHFNHTVLPPLLKSCELDFVVADLEHGSFFPEALGDFAQICRMVDMPLIARVQDCEYHCISKCLDMGADGVLIPRTETMEQVETAIRSMRMFPYGKKGVGGRGLLRAGENVAEFNKNRLLFIQIESPQGVELLDEMLETYGDQIAGIIIGPADMTVSLGNQLGGCPENLQQQVLKTVSVCRKHQKSVGIFMGDDASAKKWYEAGMNIFWMSTEIDALVAELKRAGAYIRGL